MNPHAQFCHHPACSASGKVGLGNIGVHSLKERRYKGDLCQKTFVATKGTAFYRLQTSAAEVARVLTLLTHGCPRQAIVAAFGFDERTVPRWQQAAGQHCQRLHEHWTREYAVDLQHVQADELRVQAVGGVFWMAMAVAVPTRLWLGGVVSAARDLPLLLALMRRVRTCARSVKLLISVDGLSSYVTACRRVFRRPLRTGKPGRPRLVAEAGWLLGQVVKQYAKRRVVEVARRIVQGSAAAVEAVLKATQGGGVLNTAFIERLNAPFRSALAPLVRRGRALARPQGTLEAGMYLVGCAYNFCHCHHSLRLPAPPLGERKWQERTPAMAAGLTDRPWTREQLLSHAVPACPAPAVRQRRRRPKPVEPLALALAA